MSKPKVTRKQVEDIVTLLEWGGQWAEPDEKDSVQRPYYLGSAESIGHLLACWMVQVGGMDGFETAVGRDILFDYQSLKMHSRKRIIATIIKFLKNEGRMAKEKK